MRSAKDSPDFTWGLRLRLIILWSRPSIINVVLQVLTADEFLNLILEGDALLGGMADISVESAELVLVLLE